MLSKTTCSTCGRELSYREIENQELNRAECTDCLRDGYALDNDDFQDVITDLDSEYE